MLIVVVMLMTDGGASRRTQPCEGFEIGGMLFIDLQLDLAADLSSVARLYHPGKFRAAAASFWESPRTLVRYSSLR